MAPRTPPLQFDHQPGEEIPTKHKEAIRQLYGFAKIPISRLQQRYSLSYTTICRVLNYDAPERARAGRTGAPQKLTDQQLDVVIEYLLLNWDNRCLKFDVICQELDLKCTPSTLQ